MNETKDNAAGTVFWQLNGASDASLPTLEALGNSVQVASGYTPWTNETITRTEGSGGSTTNLQNLSYSWDLAGNLHQRIDNRQGLTEQFGYDSMNRLMTSTLNGGNNLTMTYDAAGNVKTKSDVGSSPYVYATAHPHAVQTAGTWSMTYDADGNMITRAGGTISWYSYNLPNGISYNGNSTQFFYNAAHQRWKQVAVYSGTAETTHYIGGLLEIMTRGSSPTEYRHQIPAGSSGVVYTRRTDGSTSTYYATSDHLGSSDLVMDSSANVLTRESFTPFGARRGSAWTGVPTSSDYTAFGNTTRKGFTGHEMLDSVALVHMNGRVYDPFLGRFLCADTLIQTLGSTESINPYAYAWNDPLRYLDPSGHGLIDSIVGIFIAAVAFFSFQPELMFLGAFWGPVAAAGLAGFVGGFTAGALATGSLSAALTAGLVAGLAAASFAGVGYYADNPELQWDIGTRTLAHAAVGCFSGAVASGNCSKGALSAAVSEYLGSQVLHGNEGGFWGNSFQTVKYALIGGITSKLEHESFDEGFSLGAAGYLFNHLAEIERPKFAGVTRDGSTLRGDIPVSFTGGTVGEQNAVLAQLAQFADANGLQLTFHQASTWEYIKSFFGGSLLSVEFLPAPPCGSQVCTGAFETLDGAIHLLGDNWQSEPSMVAHEFGHSLGLGHNDILGTLMYPITYPETTNLLLPQERSTLVSSYGP